MRGIKLTYYLTVIENLFFVTDVTAWFKESHLDCLCDSEEQMPTNASLLVALRSANEQFTFEPRTLFSSAGNGLFRYNLIRLTSELEQLSLTTMFLSFRGCLINANSLWCQNSVHEIFHSSSVIMNRPSCVLNDSRNFGKSIRLNKLH